MNTYTHTYLIQTYIHTYTHTYDLAMTQHSPLTYLNLMISVVVTLSLFLLLRFGLGVSMHGSMRGIV